MKVIYEARWKKFGKRTIKKTFTTDFKTTFKTVVDMVYESDEMNSAIVNGYHLRDIVNIGVEEDDQEKI